MLPAIGVRHLPVAAGEADATSTGTSLRDSTQSPPTDAPKSPGAEGDAEVAALFAGSRLAELQKQKLVEAAVSVDSVAPKKRGGGGSGGGQQGFFERRREHEEKMARKVAARKRAAEQAEQDAAKEAKEANRRAKERVRIRAERVARDAERREGQPAAAPLRATTLGGSSAGAVWGGNNGEGQLRSQQIRKAEAERSRQQLTAARLKVQAQARTDALEGARRKRRAVLGLSENAADGECEAAEQQRHLDALEEARRQGQLQAQARAEAVLRAEAEARAVYTAEVLEARRQSETLEQTRRASQEQAEAQLGAEQAARVEAEARAVCAIRALEAATLPRARSAGLDSESDTYEGDLGSPSGPVPDLVNDLPLAASAPLFQALAAGSAAALMPPTVSTAGLPADCRSKPLWAATAAELLAELMLRQKGEPAAWPAGAAAIAQLLPGSPVRLTVGVAEEAITIGKVKAGPRSGKKPRLWSQDGPRLESAEAAADTAVAVAAEQRVADKMARSDERRRRQAAEKAEKAEKAAVRRAEAAARAKCRRPPPDKNSDALGGDVDVPALAEGIDREYGAGTHAADMRRLMLEARKRDEGTKAAAEVETAKAEEHFKERTEFDADGTKFRVKADGTRVKIVRKPCPEGQGLRTAVMEMASAVGWSEYQLNSRLGGWGSEEQGYRSVWLHLRKAEKAAAKLEALKSKEQHQGGPVVKPWHKKAKAASTQANNKLETVETDACANAADAVGAGIG